MAKIEQRSDMEIQVNPDQAAEWVFRLFEEQQWLLSETPNRHQAPDTEQEAVSFLLALAEQGANDWRGISKAARETVVLLLTDFIAQLMHPQSPMANRTWRVDGALSPVKKALSIIAFEIRRSHPHFSGRH